MGINHLQRTAQHSHPVKMDRIRQQMQQTDQSSIVDKRTGDHADISEAGRLALKEKMVQMEKWERTEEIKGLPSLNSGAYGIMQDFEEMVAAQEGPKTNTFDGHVDKMTQAYQMMKERIEEKYAAPQGRKEYYTAKDGSMQELTKDKELEMLDEAYETHSRFMAASTQIWSELQDFKARIEYHSNGAQDKAPASKKHSVEMKEQAYNVFMSAIGGKNEKGLASITQETRKALNGIWDAMRGMVK